VQVDHAGHDPARPEIDELVARGDRRLARGQDLLDLAVLDQHERVVDEARSAALARERLRTQEGLRVRCARSWFRRRWGLQQARYEKCEEQHRV